MLSISWFFQSLRGCIGTLRSDKPELFLPSRFILTLFLPETPLVLNVLDPVAC
jgi:hypothetical protein